MSELVNAAAMPEQFDAHKLVEEIGRYLAAVDLFRAEGCGPVWRPDMHSIPKSLERSLSDLPEHRVVH